MSEMIKNRFGNLSPKSLKTMIKLFFGEEYLKNKIISVLILAAIFINIATWLGLFLFFRVFSSSAIILHYNVYFGVDLMGGVKRVYILPIIGLIILIINFFLAIYFYKIKERIAAYLFLIGTLAVQLSLLVSIISVILINY